MRSFSRSLLALLFPLVACSVLQGQSNPNLEQGFKPYGSYDASKLDSVNLMNGNLTVTIPLINYPQRGSLRHNIVAVYNNKGWSVNEHCDTMTEVCSSKWRLAQGSNDFTILSDDVLGGKPFLDVYGRYIYSVEDYSGASHQLGDMGADPSRPGYNVYRALDGAGYYLSTTVGGKGSPNQTAPAYTKGGNGNLSWSTVSNGSGIGSEDTDGNMITGSSALSVTDTLGRNITYSNYLSTDTSGCRGPRQLSGATLSTFPGPNGGTTQIKSCTGLVTLSTDFGALDENGNLIAEVPPGSSSLTQSIIIYDGNSWSTSPQWIFEYADNSDGTNYGDVTKVTLPTGGSISYTWVTVTPCSYIPGASRMMLITQTMWLSELKELVGSIASTMRPLQVARNEAVDECSSLS